MLAIVDYEAGNQTSVARALKSLGVDCLITDSPERLASADGIIFPGVGAAPQAMRKLEASGIGDILRQVVRKGIPLLGICLGCQILLEESEEGPCRCLGLLPGKVRKFPDNLRQEDGSAAPVPHMGWNGIRKTAQSPILEGIADNAEFYFVHSYYPEPAGEMILARTSYGKKFCAIYGRDGLWAAQFHPEKSGRAGLRLLANFNAWCKENRPCSQNA